MYEANFPKKRYKQTMAFLKKHISKKEKILDLGVDNPLSQMMVSEGYEVENTKGEDLDLDFNSVEQSEADVVTAFEIFEHMVAPFNVLRSISSDKLVASIPLRLWFSRAYRSEKDPWDRHFHEFEEWQFDWLLEKAGWKIIDRARWTNPVNKLGFRPFLRLFTARYYIVYAERNTQ